MSNNIKREDFQAVLKNNDENHLLQFLKKSYLITNPEDPESVQATEEDLKFLILCLKKASQSFNLLLLKEIFRCFRNCCINNRNFQDSIPKSVLHNSQSVLKHSSPSNDQLDLLDSAKSQSLNFLINYCRGNQKTSEICFSLLIKDFQNLLSDKKLYIKSTALLYYILLWSNVTLDINIIISIINLVEKSEFATFIIEFLLKNGLIDKYYECLTCNEDRVVVLNVMQDLQFNRTAMMLTKKFVLNLVNDFKRKSDCVLKTVTDYLKDIEPMEVALLASVIATLTSLEEYLCYIKSDRSLLINCAFLLKSIHMAGKEENNDFTPFGKLEDLAKVNKDHPIYGFKANMIRILANLAWKSPINQDEIRNLDCIPFILDCCNVDGKNPFIMQWVVYALKVLCDQNEENQKIIASLSKQSAVDSKLLNEVGLTLHEDEKSQIRIVFQ